MYFKCIVLCITLHLYDDIKLVFLKMVKIRLPSMISSQFSAIMCKFCYLNCEIGLQALVHLQL